ncbi:Fur family transcriptional regulator, ferric uptake regulator [Chitinophaga jiangningensis]|uniref:Fur family transcriptional regulator, ferric uptake regulator n=1 Tax=Chitinophaga jiangningensis TaxID=1419482 RepID=A0A1M7E4G0_9BACT|nr:transcriptional repressor [Chitinophaga jiangningensis]SHL86587.1 Fur family transcriptional regulator, ferric uptake regulator [Chitinophaga jiangningensis]
MGTKQQITERITALLKDSKLSVTETRVKILELFMKSNGALEHSDIETQTGQSFDRVTVYRTLQTFLDKGIIHKIPTTDTSVRYAVCKSECTEHDHHDHHVHFKCESCGNTTCLDETNIPEISLPKGYAMHNVEVVVSGVCKTCK